MRKRWKSLWPAEVWFGISLLWFVVTGVTMANIWPYGAPWWAWVPVLAPVVPWLALGLCILARYVWRNPPFRREWESSKDLRET